jgi:hypothetical protein
LYTQVALARPAKQTVPRCHEQHCMVANCTLMHALVHLRCGCDTQKRQMRSILHLSPAPVRFRCDTGCRQKKPATRSTRHSCKTQTQAQRSNVSKSTRYACYWLQMIVVWSARAEGGDEIAGRLARAHCCAIRPRFTARRMQSPTAEFLPLACEPRETPGRRKGG